MDIHGTSVDGQSSWDRVRDVESSWRKWCPAIFGWRKSRKFKNHIFMDRLLSKMYFEELTCGDWWTPKWNMKQLACDCHSPPVRTHPPICPALLSAPFTDTRAPISTVTSPVASMRQDESEMIWHPAAFLGSGKVPFEKASGSLSWKSPAVD